MIFKIYAEIDGYVAVVVDIYPDSDELVWKLFCKHIDGVGICTIVDSYGMRFTDKQLEKVLNLLPKEWKVFVVSKVVARLGGVDE